MTLQEVIALALVVMVSGVAVLLRTRRRGGRTVQDAADHCDGRASGDAPGLCGGCRGCMTATRPRGGSPGGEIRASQPEVRR